MAIRTITDLPDISTASELSSNLSKSRMEISYLEDDENNVYVSRSVSCGVLAQAIAASIVANNWLTSEDIDVTGHITAKDGLSVNGNFYANNDNAYLEHDAKLNFQDIDIKANTFKVAANSTLNLNCGNASMTMLNATDGNGIVDLKQYAKVNNTKDEADYIVNVKFLKEKLDLLSANLIHDINAGIAKIDVNVDIDFPLLGIIYVDHKIPSANTAWAIAGSTIDLLKHPKLKEYVERSDIRLRYASDGGNDTWSYLLNGTNLKLPTTDWFFLSIKTGTSTDESLSCTFKNAGLPAHSHTYSYASEDTKFSYYAHLEGGGGYYSGISNSSTSTGSYSFGTTTDTVQPNATKMFVYFYVGQEKTT